MKIDVRRTHEVKRLVGAAMLIAVAACNDSPTLPGVTVPPDTLPPDTATIIPRADFGQYQADAVVEVSGLTSAVTVNDSGIVAVNVVIGGATSGALWKKGVTTPVSTSDGGMVLAGLNDRGDVAGRVAGRLAVLYSGEVAPAYIFRADTDVKQTSIYGINDRREVALSLPTRVWFANEVRDPGGDTCSPVGGFNNLGVLLVTQCFAAYPSTYFLASPFGGTTTVQSGKLSGKNCHNGGRYHNAVAVNDSNETITSFEVSPGGGGVHSGWFAGAGCLDLTVRYPGLSFSAFNSNGLLGGSRPDVPFAVPGFPTAVLANEVGAEVVDDALDDASRSAWHVLTISRITNSGFILATGIRLSDNRRFALLLTRVK
jgi:hypothetical protein